MDDNYYALQREKKVQLMRDKIRLHLGFLFDCGFNFTPTTTTFSSMGYWEINLCSKELLIKIYNERGEIMLMMSPTKTIEPVWFDLSVVIYTLSGEQNFIGVFEGNLYTEIDEQFERYGQIIKQYYSEIVKILNVGYENNYENLVKNRSVINHLVSQYYVVSQTGYMKKQ